MKYRLVIHYQHHDWRRHRISFCILWVHLGGGGGSGGPIKATVRSFPSLQTDFWFQLCKEWSTQGHVVIGRYVNDGVVRFLLHRCSLTSVLKDGQYFYPFVVTVIVYVILERLLQPPLFVNKIQLRTSPVNHNALHFEVLRNFKFQLNCE